MVHLVIELSKYLAMVMILFFTYHAYMAAIARTAERKNRLCRRMMTAVYIIHGTGFLVLYLKEPSAAMILLYCAELLVLLLAGALYRNFYPGASKLIFSNMLLFLSVGYLMITRLSFDKGLRQFLFSATMLTLCLVVPKVIERLNQLEYAGIFFTVLGIAVLAIVLIFGVEQYGAKNWLQVGGILLQPSEFVKIFFVFGIASMLRRDRSFSAVIGISALAACHVLLLISSRDLGGALIFFVTYVVMLYAATGKMQYLFAGAAALVAASVPAYFLFDHVQVRVEAFLNPFGTITGSGYQVSQSLFAIGTGGWFGMGLTGGMPESIPVADSDFIFSAIAEEFGTIFAICLILICINTFLMFINLSLKLERKFYKLISLGFSVIYMVQVFLNIGGVLRFIPSTGVTLPLLSYGGSSVVVSIFLFQVIQGLYCRYQKEYAAAGDHRLVSGSKGAEDRVNDRGNAGTESIVNKPVLRLTYGMAVLFFGMIGYLGWFQFSKADTVINNSYNQRQTLLEETCLRGSILTSDGVTVAETMELEDGSVERRYPFGSMYAHVVGRTLQGRTGVELAENFTMLTSHINIVEKIALQLQNERIPGDTVVTTLDSRLQQAAYEALGSHRGAVVVLEPSTGRVLAMVSKPDYNPNTVVGDWQELIAADNDSSALLNRAVNGIYAPGSTFKILTLLEYYREHGEAAEDYSYTCTGEDTFHGVTIHCAGNRSHGTQSLRESFANSCNSSFANIGTGLDLDRFSSLCKTMLFGQALPGDFATAASSFPLNSMTDPAELPQGIIGLGKTEMTPFHNVLITAAIANGGVLMKPYLVDRIEDADGRTVSENSPSAYDSLMSSQEAAMLTEYMTYVVETGTASKLSGMGITVAGKTGTATYDTTKEPHAWFVGFAPAENPQIAICVLMETAGSGSSYAVPAAKKVIEAYLKNR